MNTSLQSTVPPQTAAIIQAVMMDSMYMSFAFFGLFYPDVTRRLYALQDVELTHDFVQKFMCEHLNIPLPTGDNPDLDIVRVILSRGIATQPSIIMQ